MSDKNRLAANNFDLLRLIFAVAVCFSHSYELSQFQEIEWIRHGLSSDTAVKSFFVISGFLIFMSHERSATLGDYAGKRLRRIYPAYFTIVMCCALGLAAASTRPLNEYFSLPWLGYLAANLVFLNFLWPTLPGVFEHNTLPVVNGALWTLKIEVLFYIAVPLLADLFRRHSRPALLIAFYCLSVFWSLGMTMMAQRTGSAMYVELGRQLPGQLSFFLAGAAIYYYMEWFKRYAHGLVLGAAAILFTLSAWPIHFLEPLALAIIVVYFGVFFPMGNFSKYGDFSYGVYIVHFPTIQLLLASGWFTGRPGAFLGAVIFLTALASFAMWHLVEKRFLSRNSHYIAKQDKVE